MLKPQASSHFDIAMSCVFLNVLRHLHGCLMNGLSKTAEEKNLTSRPNTCENDTLYKQ